jgi:hypothetical protein
LRQNAGIDTPPELSVDIAVSPKRAQTDITICQFCAIWIIHLNIENCQRLFLANLTNFTLRQIRLKVAPFREARKTVG